jgi:general secretion pathway protein H
VELIIVLVVAGLLIGLVAPRLGSGFRKFKEREFLQEFAAALKETRHRAMRSGRAEVFRIIPAERRYGSEPVWRSIPGNVEVRAEHLARDGRTGDFAVTFQADGSNPGESIQLIFDDARSVTLRVDGLFGNMTWDKGK